MRNRIEKLVSVLTGKFGTHLAAVARSRAALYLVIALVGVCWSISPAISDPQTSATVPLDRQTTQKVIVKALRAADIPDPRSAKHVWKVEVHNHNDNENTDTGVVPGTLTLEVTINGTDAPCTVTTNLHGWVQGDSDDVPLEMNGTHISGKTTKQSGDGSTLTNTLSGDMEAPFLDLFFKYLGEIEKHPNDPDPDEMYFAVKNHDIDSIKRCLAADPDLLDETCGGVAPLDVSVDAGYSEDVPIATYLLDQGATVHDEMLWEAVQGSDPAPMVKLLIDHGAKPAALAILPYELEQNRSQTDQVLQLLLDHGAPVNAQNKDGETALYLAADHGAADVVQLLLDHGADKTIKNNHGWTPVNEALNESHWDVAKQLGFDGAYYTVHVERVDRFGQQVPDATVFRADDRAIDVKVDCTLPTRKPEAELVDAAGNVVMTFPLTISGGGDMVYGLAASGSLPFDQWAHRLPGTYAVDVYDSWFSHPTILGSADFTVAGENTIPVGTSVAFQQRETAASTLVASEHIRATDYGVVASLHWDNGLAEAAPIKAEIVRPDGQVQDIEDTTLPVGATSLDVKIPVAGTVIAYLPGKYQFRVLSSLTTQNLASGEFTIEGDVVPSIPPGRTSAFGKAQIELQAGGERLTGALMPTQDDLTAQVKWTSPAPPGRVRFRWLRPDGTAWAENEIVQLGGGTCTDQTAWKDRIESMCGGKYRLQVVDPYTNTVLGEAAFVVPDPDVLTVNRWVKKSQDYQPAATVFTSDYAVQVTGHFGLASAPCEIVWFGSDGQLYGKYKAQIGADGNISQGILIAGAGAARLPGRWTVLVRNDHVDAAAQFTLSDAQSPHLADERGFSAVLCKSVNGDDDPVNPTATFKTTDRIVAVLSAKQDFGDLLITFRIEKPDGTVVYTSDNYIFQGVVTRWALMAVGEPFSVDLKSEDWAKEGGHFIFKILADHHEKPLAVLPFTVE